METRSPRLKADSKPERVERFAIKIHRLATMDPEKDLIAEVQRGCDDVGIEGWFRVIERTTIPGGHEFTILHERSLDHENEVFERSQDPTDAEAIQQILGEYQDARDQLHLPWTKLEIGQREVDSTGLWLTVPSPGNERAILRQALQALEDAQVALTAGAQPQTGAKLAAVLLRARLLGVLP